MKTIILVALIIMAGSLYFFSGTQVAYAQTTQTYKQDSTKKEKRLGRQQAHRAAMKAANSDSTHINSDLDGSNNKTLDRTDVNGGNDRDINSGNPLPKTK